MRKYFPNETVKYNNTIHGYTTIRVAYITDVNAIKGTVKIQWMDHPGTRDDVVISHSALGNYEFPVAGSVVLIGMRAEIPEIIRYISPSYTNQVSNGLAPKMNPGEKVFRSYKSQSPIQTGIPVPSATGAEIRMTSDGIIKLSTGLADSIKIDPNENSIELDSMNTHVSTEAGILDFGIIKKNINGTDVYYTKNSIPVEIGGQPFNEFRLRVAELSDNDALSPANVENPYIEFCLGTSVSNGVVETSSTGKQIACKLKIKGDTSAVFNFTVDKSGNVQMSVDGTFVISCDDINLGGDSGEPLLLKSFGDSATGHTHSANGSGPPNPTTGTHTIKVKAQ